MGVRSEGAVKEPGGAAIEGVLTIQDLQSATSQAVLQETRLRILAILASAEAHRRGGYSLQELGQLLDCSPQNAHHHLRILSEARVARVLRAEATQRIPRQFWVSDVHTVRLRPDGFGTFVVEIGSGVPRVKRLGEAVARWADEEGGEEAHVAALQLAVLLADLGPEASVRLLDLMRRHLSG